MTFQLYELRNALNRNSEVRMYVPDISSASKEVDFSGGGNIGAVIFRRR